MKKHMTLDRSGINPIHTVEQIGPKRHKTPEGFLLCLDVPLARIGTMFYGPGETPVTAGRDNIARVTRDAATLFAKDTIASFNGKAVVNEHPPVDVNASNWKQYSVGVCLNVRQGTGDHADVILGDLLITDAATIRDVETGKREVSAGYEADYQQTGEGEGRQTNIIGNHIALVERGRCGPRCAIGDHQPTKEQPTMGTQTKSASPPVGRRPLPESIRKLFKDTLEEMAGEAGDADLGGGADADTDTGPAGGGDSHTHIHIHQGGASGGAPDTSALPGDDGLGGGGEDLGADAGGGDLESRIAQLESTVSMLVDMLGGGGGEELPDDTGGEGGEELPDDTGGEEVPAPTKDTRTVTTDSAALEASFRTLIADAEILVPGFRLPTFDATSTRASTLDRMCATRRGVLGHLASTLDGQNLIDSVSNDGATTFDVAKATCADIAVVFKAAAGAKRLLNNSNMTRDAGKMPPGASVTMPGAAGGVMSLAQLNAQNQAYWAARNQKAAAK